MTHHATEQAVTKSIVVALDVAKTFRVWTEQIAAWWPASHSLSGDPKTQVFIEGKVGGRFYERASNGDEFDWGAVEVWDPPHRFVFSWYLGSSQELPTRVEVQFISLAANQTRIELEHRGPELIGPLWEQRVAIFKGGWDSVLAKFEIIVS
jgi:uncharacterized protein YndB with AHSA1/START domain